jgi:hypothetical protein
MISTILMIAVAVLLTFVLAMARQSRVRQARLERELARHRETVQSILRELQNT